MISLEDCVALSGLTEEQVLAIAEHEHLPEIAATALAQYLSKQEHGIEKIRDMIVDDIRQAQQRRDKPHIKGCQRSPTSSTRRLTCGPQRLRLTNAALFLPYA